MKCIKIFLLSLGLLAAVRGGLFPQTQQSAPENKKRIEIEASLGISGINPAAISRRASGIGALIEQYAGYYQLNTTTNGNFAKIKRVIPFNISANYGLRGKWSRWYLKAGIDYGTGSASSAKTYQLGWTDFTENYEYKIDDNISYVIPQLGVGIRFSFLDVYGAVGLGFARMTYTEGLTYSEPGSAYEAGHDFKVKGNAPAFILGMKYRIKLSKNPGSNLHAFVKLEALVLKVKSLEGSKTASGNASDQAVGTRQGTLYTFQWDPYGLGGFEYWDLYETQPTPGEEMRNFARLPLQLSGIRLMIGISF